MSRLRAAPWASAASSPASFAPATAASSKRSSRRARPAPSGAARPGRAATTRPRPAARRGGPAPRRPPHRPGRRRGPASRPRCRATGRGPAAGRPVAEAARLQDALLQQPLVEFLAIVAECGRVDASVGSELGEARGVRCEAQRAGRRGLRRCSVLSALARSSISRACRAVIGLLASIATSSPARTPPRTSWKAVAPASGP